MEFSITFYQMNTVVCNLLDNFSLITVINEMYVCMLTMLILEYLKDVCHDKNCLPRFPSYVLLNIH